MSEKTAAEKARVKAGVAVAAIDAAPGIVESLGLPEDATFTDADAADLVFLFVLTQADLEGRLPEAVAALKPGAAVWVFFRKGSKAAGHDVNRDSIWALAERLGLRPLGLLGIDETWSAFRLRPDA